MHVVVLGSGVIGVTSAWYLACAGYRVTVLDRQPACALETSFANAGQISPGYSTPWAAPGIPLKSLSWLLQRHSPLSFRPDGTLWQLQWMHMLLRNCNARHYAINKERMVRLAVYSRECLRQLREQTGIRYEERALGTLQIFRNRQQLDAVGKDIAVLARHRVAYELLSPQGCINVEPALLHIQDKLTGGLRLPGDETGDCQLFTSRLALAAQTSGVHFRYNMPVTRILHENNRITGVQAGMESMTGDHYVIALGSYTRNMLQPLGLDIPVYPVKGYSLTLPVTDPAAAPISTIMDETYKVAITRFENRIRIGGMAELSGFNLELNPLRKQTLAMVVNDLFPNSGHISSASFWAGLRPMTPDGTPIVGPTRYDNLWLNTGHGTLGWTMACGSARLLADLIAQRKPDIRADDFALARYA